MNGKRRRRLKKLAAIPFVVGGSIVFGILIVGMSLRKKQPYHDPIH
jgi:hypothetical protein